MRMKAFAFVVFIIVVSMVSSTLFFEHGPSIVAMESAPNADKSIPEGVGLLMNHSGLPHHTTAFNGPRKVILQNGNDIYFAYTWMNGTRMTLTMIASYDNGDNWTSPLDIWEDRTSHQYENLPHMGLYIWKEQFVLIWLTGQIDRNLRQLLCVKSPISDWRGLANASVMTIRSFEGSNWEIAFDDNNLYLAEVRSGEWQAYFYKYNNSTWTGPVIINNPGSTMRVAMETVDTDQGRMLLYFYCRPLTPGYSTGMVHLKTSVDGGSTWSSEKTVMDNSNDYSMIVCEKVQGRLYLFASRLTQDEIDMTISTDNGSTWSPEKMIISERGLNKLDSAGDTDFSIGFRNMGKTFLLAYEGSSNEIRMIYSLDRGITWTNESSSILLHGNTSYGVCISANGDFFSCVADYGGALDNVHLCDMRGISTGNVTRSPPMIMNNDITKIYANDTYRVQYHAYDPDTPFSQLTWSILTNASWLSFSTSGVLNGNPSVQDAGSFWVNVSVSDGHLSDWSNFTLRVLVRSNNLTEYDPVVISIQEDDTGFVVLMDAYFMEQHGYKVVDYFGSVNLHVEVDDDGNVIVIPREDWAGTETITLVFEKEGVRIEREMEITVVNVNDPPVTTSINLPEDKIFEGDQFKVSTVTDDPDIPYGDKVSYTWFVDGVEFAGDADLMVPELTAGHHNISVVSKDLEGATSYFLVDITVLKREEGEDDGTSTLVMIIIAFIAIIIVLAVSMLVFMIYHRGRQKRVEKTDRRFDTGPEVTTPVVGSKAGPSNLVRTGVIGGPIEFDVPISGPSIPVRISIPEIYREVQEGEVGPIEDREILKNLRRMRREGEISKETYDMILQRLDSIS
ncbi:MAG: hypothetical protein JW939_03405 [Candidatus Thermoplasmatota archaeon]|nr:hypothetical protein [Candidatus Thermoplasmatota archaeon]